MSEWPDLIDEFISFDDDDPFEVVKLGGAILFFCCQSWNFDCRGPLSLHPVY